MWSTCSPDILLLIFKLLDYQALLTCMSVCTMWRDVVDYIGQHNDLWQKLAEVGMYNKGITYKQKSILNWRDMYLNSLLWKSMKKASLKLHGCFEIQNVRNFHVYKDNLIIIGDSGIVTYYNVDTYEVTKVLEESYLDYQESDHITVKRTTKQIIEVYLKHGKTSYSFTDPGSDIVKLTDDRCYVLHNKYALWLVECCNKKNEKRLVTRSYGSNGTICDINIYGNIIYILSQNGNVFRSDDSSFRFKYLCKLFTTDFYQSNVLAMFQMCSVVYTAPAQNGTELSISSHIGDEVVVECPGLSCATPHGDALFLGCEDGKIVIYMRKKMAYDISTFNIRDIAGNTSLENPAIKAIDVYEAKGAHYLFIVTQLAIYKVLVTDEGTIANNDERRKDDCNSFDFNYVRPIEYMMKNY